MTDDPKELTLADVDRPIIVIVALKSQREAKEQVMPHMHLPYYQVTIDPGQCRGTTNGYSPSGNFMRFGYAQGDELTGWQPAHEIEIFEIVAEVEEGEAIYPGQWEDQLQDIMRKVEDEQKQQNLNHLQRDALTHEEKWSSKSDAAGIPENP